MEGIKNDSEKLRWDLLPIGPIEEIVKVLNYGARKYSEDNWKKVKPLRTRYYAAALRHIFAWWRGESIDQESGISHLAHALCCLVFLREAELCEIEL